MKDELKAKLEEYAKRLGIHYEIRELTTQDALVCALVCVKSKTEQVAAAVTLSGLEIKRCDDLDGLIEARFENAVNALTKKGCELEYKPAV
jgi:ERCC4-type nuclease